MITEKLLKVQVELKAPKDKRNNFGNYNYRSAESILESAKPLLDKYKLSLTLTDEMVMLGDRFYVKATAFLVDVEDNSSTEVTAYAREEADKKGMDASQITGTASSYARKYALNGLFLIDDTKDADTDEYQVQTTEKIDKKTAATLLTTLTAKNVNVEKLCEQYKINTLAELTPQQYTGIINKLKEKDNVSNN